MKSIVTPIIPNNYAHEINKKDFNLMKFFRQDVVFAITCYDYKEYNEKEIEEEVNNKIDQLANAYKQKMFVFIEEEDIEKEFRNIKIIAETSKHPQVYDTALLRMHLSTNLLLRSGTGGVHQAELRCKTKDNTEYTITYCSTNPTMLAEYHMPSLQKIRTEYINKLISTTKPKSKNRTPIGPKIRHEVFKRDNYKCVECGGSKEEKTLHIDHILPVSQGGTDELSNLRTLCQQCNLAKSNRAW